MVLSELIGNLNNSTSGKVVVGAIAVLAVGGVGFMVFSSAECSNNGGYGPQVSPAVAATDFQKELDQVKASTNLPPGLKDAEIKHLEGEIAQAKGQKPATTTPGPPTGKP